MTSLDVSAVGAQINIPSNHSSSPIGSRSKRPKFLNRVRSMISSFTQPPAHESHRALSVAGAMDYAATYAVGYASLIVEEENDRLVAHFGPDRVHLYEWQELLHRLSNSLFEFVKSMPDGKCLSDLEGRITFHPGPEGSEETSATRMIFVVDYFDVRCQDRSPVDSFEIGEVDLPFALVKQIVLDSEMSDMPQGNVTQLDVPENHIHPNDLPEHYITPDDKSESACSLGEATACSLEEAPFPNRPDNASIKSCP